MVGAGFQHGVADEGAIEAVLREPGRFEGQQAEELVPQARVVLHAMGAPGPDLRGDVVDAAGGAGGIHVEDAMHEAGAVDGDDDIGLAGTDVGLDLGQAALEQADAGNDLDDAHDGEVGEGEEGVEAMLGHAGAADAREGCVGREDADGGHEAGAEDVAAGLAGDEIDEGHRLLGVIAGCIRGGRSGGNRWIGSSWLGWWQAG